MKFTKRLFAFVLVAVMLATSCVFVNAEEKPVYNATELGEAVTIGSEKVTYQKFTVDSGEAFRTETVVSMEFDPADGYIPMVFSGYSGTSGVLSTQYDLAVKKYGYDVVGVINGAFFSMDSGNVTYGNYGTLSGIVISNGKVASAHAGYADSVVAFGSDGSMNIVRSGLDYKLYIKGAEIKNGIYYINKTSGSKVAGNWNNGFYYYDTSCGSVCDTYAVCPGYEVICEKTENTDLCVGTTLKGKVLEVKENSYGASIADDKYDLSDKFVLFVKSSSPNAAYVKDLVAGDAINIAVNETVEASKEIIENANSVISNVGWLVKDGVDQTHIMSTIGSHSVTLAARWTAFGQKEDGSFVFFTSEGGSTGDTDRSITLRDVAKFMMDAGCVNVIRMDGGGSSAMYVKDTGSGEAGYVQSSSRAVGDCILVVKKSSVKDEALESALQTAIDDAKVAISETPKADIEALVGVAEALLASGSAVSGDVRRYILKLASALSGKQDLEAAVLAAGTVSFKDYSEPILALLRAAYDKGSALLADNNASIEDIEAVTVEINELLTFTGANTAIVTKGKKYTTTAPNRKDGWDDDGVRLTDGSKGSEDGGSTKYAGWNKTSQGFVEVVIDLGEATDVNYFRAYVTGGNWGITAANKIKAYVSNDGEKFTEVASADENVLVSGSGQSDNTWSTYTITAVSEKTKSARFVKIEIYGYNNGFVWADEVEAGLSAEAVTDAISINGFNTSIGAGDCFIFTSAMESLEDSVANLKYTGNVLAKWDEELGAYVVTKVVQGSGSLPKQLADDEIVIGAHDWETGVNENTNPPAVIGSAENKKLALKAKVGQIVELHGIDVKTLKIELGAYVKIVDKPVPEFVKGDVNGNGSVDANDYALAKRHCLKTYTLTEEMVMRADLNGNGTLEASEYAMIKRHVLGTFVIK